ncbi:MAG: two-component system response regulator QseB [Cellvibrionaceae bacterium]|jgi:two-component system response regulator QseB
MRILLVEDDIHLGKATEQGLKQAFAVDWVFSAEEAEKTLKATKYNLLILDINLPGKSGLDLLRQLRRNKVLTPVLLLTARDAIEQRVEGLNSGADDYLVKPFDLDELLARANALIRRGDFSEPIITLSDISYEPVTGYLTINGKTVTLSQRENAIFDCLIRNKGRPVSKAKIEESIYDWSSESIGSNTIEVHIAALRKKLGKERIKTIRSIGYCLSL